MSDLGTIPIRLQDRFDEEVRKARNEGLEEAAELAGKTLDGWAAAIAIRALKDKP